MVTVLPLLLHGTQVLTAATCIPSNTLLSGPLAPAFNLLTGGLGGIIQPVTILLFAVMLILCLFGILSKQSGKFMKSAIWVLSVPIAGILAYVIYVAIYTGLNTSGIC